MGSGTCSCSYATPISRNSLSRRFLDPATFPTVPKNARKARRRATKLLAGLSPEQLQELVSPALDHIFFAYERVVMPCHNMNCGDVVHRRWASLITVVPHAHFVSHASPRCHGVWPFWHAGPVVCLHSSSFFIYLIHAWHAAILDITSVCLMHPSGGCAACQDSCSCHAAHWILCFGWSGRE